MSLDNAIFQKYMFLYRLTADANHDMSNAEYESM